MKYIIYDINELTDSRELMESKINPFVAWFTYIMLLLLIVALVWSFFGEIDDYVKANGIVRPSDKISTIKNKVPGKVEEVLFTEGQRVNKGDVLYTIDYSTLKLERNNLNKDLNNAKLELVNLKNLRQNILDNQIIFDESIEVAGAVESSKFRFQVLKETLQSLTLLKHSIEQGECLLSIDDNMYYQQYQDYQMNVERLKNIVSEARINYERNIALEEAGAISKKELEDSARVYNNAELELSKYKNEYLLNVNAKIDGYSTQLSNDIIEYQKTVEKLDASLKELEIRYEDYIVKAPIDGVVQVIMEIAQQDLLLSGEEVCTIVPEAGSDFKVQLYVSNKDIASIQVGQKIKYHFLALPYREYGELTGKITNISADSRDDNRGASYYIVEASIDNKTVYSYKGEKGEIKTGMACEAQIIKGSKKILDYLLEKLSLKD